MNAKISLPELIDMLSRKCNCTKKEAEQFLKEFFSLASDTVSQGENLKINGLGQFRSVWVEPRASVNVRTGEPMEIPGHYKLSFAPDKAMREAVNAPFSCFIPEVLPDDALPDEIAASDDNDSADETEEEEMVEVGIMTDEETSPEETTAATCHSAAAVPESAAPDAEISAETSQEPDGAEPTPEPVAATDEAGREEILSEPEVENIDESESESEAGNAGMTADDEEAGGQPGEEEEEEVKKLTEEELDALADFVFEKIVAEAQAAAEEVAPKNNREDAATSAGKTEVEFPGETACEPESRSESCEPEGAGMETAAVAETAPSDSSEVSGTRVANGPEATDYEEDEEDDDAPSMWDKMQRRPILTTLCAILFLLLILAGGTLWNLNRRGITLSDAWNYYFPTEQPSVAETAREATPHSTEEETLPAENNPAPTVVSEKETTPVADPVDVQALPPIAVHRLGRGDRLTLLALEFYGSKDFWVYIYEENKDVMPNPNRLSIGLEVKIPDPRKYAIDADSPSSLAKAKAFADALNEKFD